MYQTSEERKKRLVITTRRFYGFMSVVFWWVRDGDGVGVMAYSILRNQ